MLRTRNGASQPVTPSAAYASEAEPPLLHITTLTTVYGSTLRPQWPSQGAPRLRSTSRLVGFTFSLVRRLNE